jgi:predicted MFS family arabinose efflux permease
MPQAIAAMCMKMIMPRLLKRVGYRGVLVSNTLILGVLLMVFATIGLRTPDWLILLQAFLYGAFTSLQYTSMNTLVYADITEEDTSNASSIASTMQQMSISFGVAAAGPATATMSVSILSFIRVADWGRLLCVSEQTHSSATSYGASACIRCQKLRFGRGAAAGADRRRD